MRSVGGGQGEGRKERRCEGEVESKWEKGGGVTGRKFGGGATNGAREERKTEVSTDVRNFRN